MGLHIEMSGKINKCREVLRNGNKAFVLNVSHIDDNGSETVIIVNSDRPVGSSPNIIDMVVELSSYKRAEAFMDQQTGQARAYQKDVPTFRLVG